MIGGGGKLDTMGDTMGGWVGVKDPAGLLEKKDWGCYVAVWAEAV